MENKLTFIVKQKTDDQLLGMIYQFDEWSPEMLSFVEKELGERGKLPADIAVKKEQSIKKEDFILSRGKPASLLLQVFGWIFVLGFIGMAIGYHYAFSKTRSKYTGKEYYKYDPDSRQVGRYMFYTSISVSGLVILYQLMQLI